MSSALDDDDDPLLPGRLTPQQLEQLESFDNPYNQRSYVEYRRHKFRPIVHLSRGWITVCGFKLPVVLLLLFLVPPLLLLLSLSRSPYSSHIPILSNGTHSFHPTTLLVSIDGFRPDYLDTYADLLPNLIQLGRDGLRAQSIQPVFPTLTFPNHWALQTGLYVESHGIVANDFYAPDLLQSFSSRKKSSWNPEWWWGEPIWSVAERGGRRAANVMWPGPPQMSSGISPSFFVPFRKATPMEKLPQIEEYLDAPIHLAPSFVQVYIPDVDTAGHRGGPESAEVEDALRRVDEFVGALRGSIDSRNLTGIVDLVLLSDHGMAATSASRLVFIDDVLGDGYADLESRDGWPSLGLRFKRGADIEAHLARLKRASNDSFAVYTKDTMPDRWHFSHGDRVAPIYLVPQLGWDEYELYGPGLTIKGCHGFDNTLPEMQAVFFAYGPWAEHAKTGPATAAGWASTSPPVLESFANLEIFNLMMRLQGLEDIAPPNNGTPGFWL